MQQKPQLISLQKIDFSEVDYSIVIAEVMQQIPFAIKRIYLLQSGEKPLERGNHAHVNSQQVLILIKGIMNISLKDTQQKKYSFSLKNESHALFIPANHWIEFHLAAHSVVLCLSSHLYDEQITIYNPDDFFSSSK